MWTRQFTLDGASCTVPAYDWMARLRAAPTCAVRIQDMRVDDMFCLGMVSGPAAQDGMPGTAGAVIVRHPDYWRFIGTWSIPSKRQARAVSHTVSGKFVFVDGECLRFIGSASVAAEPMFALISRRIQWIEKHTARDDLQRFSNHSVRPFWRGEMISGGFNAFGVPGPEHVVAPVLWANLPSPRPRSVNLPLLFENVSFWQAGPYAVRIRAGLLSTWAEALRHVTLSTKLQRDGDRIVLVDASTGEPFDEASGRNALLYRLRPGVANWEAGPDDYELIDRPVSLWPIKDRFTFLLRDFAVNPLNDIRLEVPA
ncbi:hypothetical protein [Burkholderia cepacia]|uniref:hypothetical protein n=1 Tax=Burkholderia cepacia TaxID=292 RepID=UPI002AB6E63B|nr:hypothetical protein [Burkholderia cepacia]